MIFILSGSRKPIGGAFLSFIVLQVAVTVVVLVPGVRLVPTLLGWRTKLRFYRWYRALLLLERDLRGEMNDETRRELILRLDGIEQAVNTMKVPASFADQFYGLRGHIDFVRERLMAKHGG